MSDGSPRFGADEVIQIASMIAKDDTTFVVGGQATNLWAWFYRDCEPELAAANVYTSMDIDYFGSKQAAESFRAALGGKIKLPNMSDMNTPNTALVEVEFNGKPLVIDFLNGLLGIKRRELEHGVSIIRASAVVDGQNYYADIPILHPIYCLKSRVANILHVATHRTDQLAKRQLHAAIAVVRAHIHGSLASNDWKEAKLCFQEIFRYIRSDEFGRRALKELQVDLLDIIRCFINDPRIDQRYRDINMVSMIAEINTRRSGKF